MDRAVRRLPGPRKGDPDDVWLATDHPPWPAVGVGFSEEQARDYQPSFDNARRLREITAQLEQLGLREIETDPRFHEG